jgi:Zn-finger nucleic acid-binding protein
MKSSAVSSLLRKLIGRKDQALSGPAENCRSCNQTLTEEVAGAHSVLRCPSCRGTWLTAASLGAALCEKGESQELLAVVQSDGQSEIGHTFAPSRQARGCPCCAEPMENHKFEDSGVWIDTCPQGHGIWLDRGELKLLTERKRSHNDAVKPDLEDTFEDVVSDLLLGYL